MTITEQEALYAATAIEIAKTNGGPGTIHILKEFAAKIRNSKCRTCDVMIEPRFRDLCPKHVTLMAASNFAKEKLREHGPDLMAKGLLGIQSWLASETKNNDESENPIL